MASNYYNGTSAYKIDEYYSYAKASEERQNQREAVAKKRQTLSIKRIAVAISIVFVIATAFLYSHAKLIETASEVTKLSGELEDMKVRNTQVSFDIASGVDYGVVEQKAISEFGMQHPESYQNVYVDVVQSDYAEVANKKADKPGLVEGLICSVQSLLAYIK